jgi:hypothetical protein
MVVPFKVCSIPFTSHEIDSPALCAGGGDFPAFIAFPSKHGLTFRQFKHEAFLLSRSWHRLGTTSARREDCTHACPLGAGYRVSG